MYLGTNKNFTALLIQQISTTDLLNELQKRYNELESKLETIEEDYYG